MVTIPVGERYGYCTETTCSGRNFVIARKPMFAVGDARLCKECARRLHGELLRGRQTGGPGVTR